MTDNTHSGEIPEICAVDGRQNSAALSRLVAWRLTSNAWLNFHALARIAHSQTVFRR